MAVVGRRLLLAVLITVMKPADACLAQKPTADSSTTPEELASVTLEGTLFRPAEAFDHAVLKKAWADYHDAVTAGMESVRVAIASRFDAATSKGDLDEAEKWQAVAEQFAAAGALPRQSELKNVVAATESRLKEAEGALLAAYNEAIKSSTIEKKIEDAKAIRSERDSLVRAKTAAAPKKQVSGQHVQPKKEPMSKPIPAGQWVDITRDMLGGIRRGNVIVIPPNGERVVSSRPYTPPLEIEYVCATSQNNIRLGFACNEVIFNWEQNWNELRIEGGPTGGSHVKNAGAVPPKKMLTIRQVVLPNEMSVYVDGQKRAAWVGDFSRTRDLIEVFSADSELQLQSVRVRTPPR